MGDRTIIATGPFTDDEIAELVAVVQRIEGRRPAETFHFIIDDTATNDRTNDALERLRRINPLRPGYQRIVEVEREP